MKNKKLNGAGRLLIGFLLLILGSCSKENDKPGAPSIEVVHLGVYTAEYDGVFYLGEEGHFEVNIKAPARVQKIELLIHQLSGYGTFQLNKTYEGDYVGLKDIKGFADYPVIPQGEAIGSYDFQLKVTDQLGQVTTLEKEITVLPDGEGGGHQHEH